LVQGIITDLRPIALKVTGVVELYDATAEAEGIEPVVKSV